MIWAFPYLHEDRWWWQIHHAIPTGFFHSFRWQNDWSFSSSSMAAGTDWDTRAVTLPPYNPIGGVLASKTFGPLPTRVMFREAPEFIRAVRGLSEQALEWSLTNEIKPPVFTAELFPHEGRRITTTVRDFLREYPELDGRNMALLGAQCNSLLPSMFPGVLSNHSGNGWNHPGTSFTLTYDQTECLLRSLAVMYQLVQHWVLPTLNNPSLATRSEPLLSLEDEFFGRVLV